MDYTDLKRRPLAEWIEDFRSQESQGDDIPAWIPLMICEESLAAIAALEAEVARLQSAKRVAFAFDGRGWTLRADLSDMPIALKAGDIWNLALADQPALTAN